MQLSVSDISKTISYVDKNYSYIAGIDKLVDVLDALKRVNNWQSLGLQLGLLYPTLQQIKKDAHENVEQCKTKMLAAWLKRQDNVLQIGVPSWSILQTALRRIGENDVADKVVTSLI